MKKEAVIVVAVVALAAAGCSKKNEAPQSAVPQNGATTQQMLGNGGDPHAGLKPVDVPEGAAHKGKVTSTMNSNGYTYIEVDEKGNKEWVAVMETKVKVGETVEFPDSPPMTNFESKSLKRTFEKIYFSPGIRIES